jgi:protein gp37
MAENTSIEWADSTFNPWVGCTKVSPGCDHCYAAVSTPARAMAIQWGPGQLRHRTAASTWQQPMRWERDHEAFYREHGRRRRVFCASLADVFDNEVPAPWRWDLFRLVNATPNLDWLLLTKRIGNARAMLNEAAAAVDGDFVGALCWDSQPWANVWLGVTVVNQEEADRDIPKLLATPARVRFLSIEPMLGPVSLDCWPVYGEEEKPLLHWVICGGESGPHARPMHPDWAISLRDQCAAAGVPFLFKQWGDWLPVELPSSEECYAEDGSERALEGRIRVQRVDRQDMARIGKKAAGRLLDGLEHNGFPELWL